MIVAAAALALVWGLLRGNVAGWTSAEVVGRTTSSLSAGHDERVAPICAKLRRDGRWEGEHLMYRKDGTTFRGAVRAGLLRDGEGKVVGTVAVAVDATERIAAELDLRLQPVDRCGAGGSDTHRGDPWRHRAGHARRHARARPEGLVAHRAAR